MNNPFTISFGKKPSEYIQRLQQKDLVIRSFASTPSPTNIYMITGVRGSGKTTFLTDLTEEFKQLRDWIIIDLNPDRNMLESLALQLSNHSSLEKIRKTIKMDITLPGIGMTIGDSGGTDSCEIYLDRFLTKLQKDGKKLLITIDEATKNTNTKLFSGEFQRFLRKGYPIYLLMTGLYENIRDLQNEKSLTFLYRAPRISLEPLSRLAVKNVYKRVFKEPDETAGKLSALTKGYPFAFQILGYLFWEYHDSMSFEEILGKYDEYLFEYAYEKIWSELSAKDRLFLESMAKGHLTKVSEIRASADMTASELSVYRKRLIDKGLLLSPDRGVVLFALPRFEVFVIEISKEYDIY